MHHRCRPVGSCSPNCCHGDSPTNGHKQDDPPPLLIHHNYPPSPLPPRRYKLERDPIEVLEGDPDLVRRAQDMDAPFEPVCVCVCVCVH